MQRAEAEIRAHLKAGTPAVSSLLDSYRSRSVWEKEALVAVLISRVVSAHVRDTLAR
jgi:hypothetical protein